MVEIVAVVAAVIVAVVYRIKLGRAMREAQRLEVALKQQKYRVKYLLGLLEEMGAEVRKGAAPYLEQIARLNRELATILPALRKSREAHTETINAFKMMQARPTPQHRRVR